MRGNGADHSVGGVCVSIPPTSPFFFYLDTQWIGYDPPTLETVVYSRVVYLYFTD
jgi:hypothetical protein